MDIEDLIYKSKKGDISAFMELIKERRELFYKIAFAYTNNYYDAEDCISEAAIRGFEKLGHLKQTEKFYNWFISILINTCRRKYRRKEKAASEEELMGVIAEVSYSSIEDKLIIEDLLNMLKEDERELLVLRYLNDYSLKEIASIMGIPVSTVKSRIYYSQEVDLARQNNTTTKLDATFKYKDVEFKFKEAVADETGMVVLYEVSNPRYSIDSISLKDIEANAPESWGYTLPDNDDTKTEKAFFTEVRGSTFIQMKNNPITIKIDKINDNSKNKDIAVNWSIKLQLPIKEVKTIPINKEYKLDIGTMKLKSLNISVLKTYIDYEFIPFDKSILSFSPTFAYRIDKAGSFITNSILDSEHLINFSSGESEYQPLYYSDPKEIGITLIGGSIRYEYNDGKEYYIDKTKLPMEFDFKGEKGRIISAKEKDNSVEYIFEFDKINRAYSYLGPRFEKSTLISTKYEHVKFQNQESIDNLYNNLSKVIPNFENIFTTYNFNKGAVTLKVEAPKETSDKFTIDNADKEILLNFDEIIVKP